MNCLKKVDDMETNVLVFTHFPTNHSNGKTRL